MTKIGVWVRGVLYVGVAATTYLLNDAHFREAVTKDALTCVGLIGALLLAIRMFIDTSNGDIAPKEPMKVTVENPTTEPVPTADVKTADAKDV